MSVLIFCAFDRWHTVLLISHNTSPNCVDCKHSIFAQSAPLALFSILSYLLFDYYPFGLCANFLIFRSQDIKFVIHYTIPSLGYDIRLLRHASPMLELVAAIWNEEDIDHATIVVNRFLPSQCINTHHPNRDYYPSAHHQRWFDRLSSALPSSL